MKKKRIFKQLGFLSFCLSGGFLIASIVMNLFLAGQVFAADKIDVCHATGSGSYVRLNIDVSSVDKWLTAGHGDHPNDIWPPFTTGDGQPIPGQGDIAIWNNDCKVPATATSTNTLEPTSTNTLESTSTNTLESTSTNTLESTSTNTLEPTSTNTLEPTFTNTSLSPTQTNTAVTFTPTNTSVQPTAIRPTSTRIILLPTLTSTFDPGNPTETPIPLNPTATRIAPTSTIIPFFPTATWTPVIVVMPPSTYPNVLLPVTGVDRRSFSRELPGVFNYMFFGFLGLGLILQGIAGRFDE